MKFLAEIESRLNAATPGPWKRDDYSHSDNGTEVSEVMGPDQYHSYFAIPDAEFIAHSRMDVEKLVKALRVAMDALEACVCEANTSTEIAVKACNEIKKMGEEK